MAAYRWVHQGRAPRPCAKAVRQGRGGETRGGDGSDSDHRAPTRQSRPAEPPAQQKPPKPLRG